MVPGARSRGTRSPHMWYQEPTHVVPGVRSRGTRSPPLTLQTCYLYRSSNPSTQGQLHPPPHPYVLQQRVNHRRSSDPHGARRRLCDRPLACGAVALQPDHPAVFQYLQLRGQKPVNPGHPKPPPHSSTQPAPQSHAHILRTKLAVAGCSWLTSYA